MMTQNSKPKTPSKRKVGVEIRHEKIPPGTLSLLILKTLAVHGRLHGFEIARAIERGVAGVFRVEEGSLYPALQRLLENGCITAEWGSTIENRRAKYYTLTREGEKWLAREFLQFQRATAAILKIIETGS